MKKKRRLSKTPRADEHSRKVPFSISMRKHISESWIELRTELKGKKSKGKMRKKSSRKR